MDIIKCLSDNDYLKNLFTELTSGELHDLFTIKCKISRLNDKIQERIDRQSPIGIKLPSIIPSNIPSTIK